MKRGCYKKQPDSLRQKIEDLMIELPGGMTVADLVEEFPQYTKGGISKVICDLRDAKTIFIRRWIYDHPGQKNHPRPAWDHVKNSKRQPPSSKPRPAPIDNATRLRKRRILRKQRAAEDSTYEIKHFIFNLARPVSQEHE